MNSISYSSTETKEEVHETSDLIVGCDGAYSVVRQSLMKEKTIDYAQNYISSYYLELQIPATNQGTFAMPPKHLHIWPRGEFMLIALPNQDCTFTCTLFMPSNMFEELKTPTHVIEFFKKYFIDALDLIGRSVETIFFHFDKTICENNYIKNRENLVQQFFGTKPSPLITIKVYSLKFIKIKNKIIYFV